MAEETVKIEFTKEDAAILAYLAPHKERIRALIENKVFDFRNGSITLYYNHEGKLAGIERTQKTNF